ncbi:MAG TPA: hypothetical protein VMU33_18725 [Burkholderiaceae bacterium]|nr:hypothetical protein [Burkholderiaceae bacterium]
MKRDILPLDGDKLLALEEHLARFIGLRAGVVLRRALRTVSDRGLLLQEVARQIPDAGRRSEFLLHASGLLDVRGAVEPWRWLHRLDELGTIERHLAQHVGPLAPVLVRRAAARNRIMRVLIDQLAAEIDDPVRRRSFVASVVAELRRERLVA